MSEVASKTGAAGEPTPSRPSLLVLATSGDLYGSDRGLLAALPELLEAFDVTVAFPSDGPAVAVAADSGAQVLVLPDYAFRTRLLGPLRFLSWTRRCSSASAPLDQHPSGVDGST